MLKAFVFIFHGSFQPVFGIQIHDDAALIEPVVAFGEIRLYDEREELLLCFHLQDRSIVIAEMVIGSLPQIGMRHGGNLNAVGLNCIHLWLSDPLEVFRVHGVHPP